MMRRFIIAIGYLGLVALIVLVTVGLVAYGQGIEYDFKSGHLIHTGLVLIQSSPSAAQVTLNGKRLKKKTPYRASLEEGTYSFELSKDGYHTWKKQIHVVSGEVSLAQYGLLIPDKLSQASLDAKSQIVAESYSKDHRHLAYVTGGADSGVYNLDLGSGKINRIYTPQKSSLDQPMESLSDVTWSDDASHLLIASQVAGSTMHHLLAADGTGIVNITQQYGFTFNGLKFSANNWRQLYWVSPDGLRRLDVGTQSVSAVLADKVTQFVVADERILYVQTVGTSKSLISIDGSGSKQEILQSLPDSDTYVMTYATYRGVEQLAVIPNKTHVGILYAGFFGSNPVSTTVAHNVSAASFSPDGHLVAFSSSNHMTNFDLERSGITGKLSSYEITGLDELSLMTWYDGYHLLTSQRGRLIIMDFDGGNRIDLGPIVATFPANGSGDGKSIIDTQTKETGASITSTVIRP